jgi:hypothetical protein
MDSNLTSSNKTIGSTPSFHYKKHCKSPLAVRHVYSHCTRGELLATCKWPRKYTWRINVTLTAQLAACINVHAANWPQYKIYIYIYIFYINILFIYIYIYINIFYIYIFFTKILQIYFIQKYHKIKLIKLIKTTIFKNSNTMY